MFSKHCKNKFINCKKLYNCVSKLNTIFSERLLMNNYVSKIYQSRKFSLKIQLTEAKANKFVSPIKFRFLFQIPNKPKR